MVTLIRSNLPAGDIVLTGGYTCTDTVTQGLLHVTVQENTFAFSNVTPIGWQTVGVNNSADAGNCRVCATLRPGRVQRSERLRTVIC